MGTPEVPTASWVDAITSQTGNSVVVLLVEDGKVVELLMSSNDEKHKMQMVTGDVTDAARRKAEELWGRA